MPKALSGAARAQRAIRFVTVAGSLLLAACGGGGDVIGPGGGGTPVSGTLSCAQPGGTYTQCDLSLDAAGSFAIQLVSDSCTAHGNTLILTKPVVDTLFTDGCYQPAPKDWSFPGPFAAGTPISFEVQSPKLNFPPGLHATGAYPSWELMIEDGGDQNFRDLKLTVTASP
jgi:hypothetical protein